MRFLKHKTLWDWMSSVGVAYKPSWDYKRLGLERPKNHMVLSWFCRTKHVEAMIVLITSTWFLFDRTRPMVLRYSHPEHS